MDIQIHSLTKRNLFHGTLDTAPVWKLALSCMESDTGYIYKLPVDERPRQTDCDIWYCKKYTKNYKRLLSRGHLEKATAVWSLES
jgi:hypothetical protein